MSSITAYQQAYDSGVVVAQDLLALAAPWEPGVTMPAQMFDADGLLDTLLDDYNLANIGELLPTARTMFVPNWATPIGCVLLNVDDDVARLVVTAIAHAAGVRR